MSQSATSENLVRGMIDADSLRELSDKDNTTAARYIAFDLMLVALVAVVSELYWHPVTYIIAVMFIGARLIGIASIALHEASHWMMFKDRALNDKVAKFFNIILFLPLITGFDSYRKGHFEHHKYLGKDGDPDANVYETAYERSIYDRKVRCLRLLSGIGFLFLTQQFLRRRFKRSSQDRLHIVIGITLVALLAVFAPTLLTLFLLYWVVPIATWGLFINELRMLAEHFPSEQHQQVPLEFRTHEIMNNLFDDLFVVTRGVNYHLSHHLFPTVPFYNIKALHQQIAQSTTYQSNAIVIQGYWRFLRLYLSKSSVGVG